jgi:hypothetical protein
MDNYMNILLNNDKNTWVIIERQIPSNHNCFCLSYVVWTYYMTKYSKINVSFVGASTKPLNTKGAKRKRDSIVNAYDIMKQHGENKWIEWLTVQGKKDDLTDAYLQIIGNIDKIVYNDVVSNVIVLDD